MITDFHAHVLPGADHGCSGGTEAKKQLELAYKAGVGLIVATPHFYPDRQTLNAFLERRKKAAAELLSLKIVKPDVIIGSETTVCKGIDKLEGIEELCVGGTRCILLEMPFTVWDSEYIETVKAVRDRLKLVPVMAHIDRYPVKEVQKLISLGVRCQINADGLCRLSARRRLLKWIDEGYVYALGSDIHGIEDGYVNFDKAKKLLGSRFDSLMEKSMALLSEVTVAGR
jgi:protein-tyrosine phosphatase